MVSGACHPWVAGLQGRVAFALQAVAQTGSEDPGTLLLEAGRLADRHGFDAFFLGDHPAWAPEAWTMLSLIATQTERVRLGQMVAAAPYRTPLLTARLQSDLDRWSSGRSILGLGIGWNASEFGLGRNEFDRMGIPYGSTRNRQEALSETVAIIRGLWGTEPFSFDGAHFRTAPANVPAPVQDGGVPLVIAGSGRRTLGQVARLADACNFGPGPAGGVDVPDDARARLTVLDEACDAIGRPRHHVLRSHFTHWLIVAETRRDLDAKLRRYFPDGLDAFWGSYLVAGTTDEIITHYQAFVDAGINYFVVQTLDPRDEESIALVATQVASQMAPPAGSELLD